MKTAGGPFFYFRRRPAALDLRTRSTARELIDDPVTSLDELERNMADVELVNRWFGGVRTVARLIAKARPRSVLDVGCGSGDIVRALAHAHSANPGLQLTGIDSSEQMLAIARRRTPAGLPIAWVEGRGEALPFADGSFDVAMCNLTLHHMDPGPAIELLREMRRVARRGVFVTDLRRSLESLAGALLFSRLLSRNRLTRHDAPLSVRRAYTEAEALQLARASGWRAPRVRRAAFFRLVLSDGML